MWVHQSHFVVIIDLCVTTPITSHTRPNLISFYLPDICMFRRPCCRSCASHVAMRGMSAKKEKSVRFSRKQSNPKYATLTSDNGSRSFLRV